MRVRLLDNWFSSSNLFYPGSRAIQNVRTRTHRTERNLTQLEMVTLQVLGSVVREKKFTGRSDLFRLGAKLPSAGYRQNRASLTVCPASFGDEYLHLLIYWLTSSGIKAHHDL